MMASYEQRSYAGAAADTTLAAPISAGVLAFTVATGTGSGYPDGSGGPFFVIVDYDNSSAEKIRVTSRTGDAFTVPVSDGRGNDGTAAVSHGVGAKVRHVITATDMQEANRAAVNTVGKVTAKGDVLAGTGANALGRTAVGADNTVLAADSTATTGVSFKTMAVLLQLLATTKGDVLASNGTTVVRQPVGANNTVLTADSTAAAGVSYKTLATLIALVATTKGDLLVNNGTTVIRVGVGADGQSLTADSTQAAGVKWATPAAGVTLDSTAADITATTTGSSVAGAVGKAADAGHQHKIGTHTHADTANGGQVPIAGISATGTPSAGTYLRGDGAWVSPGAGSTPTATGTAHGVGSSTLASNPPSGTTGWTAIGGSVTFVAGAGGVAVLSFAANLYQNTSSAAQVQIVAAQSTTDAVNAQAVGGQGVAVLRTTAATGVNTVSGMRVVTGLTPGTSYTFQLFGNADNGNQQYQATATPGLHATCAAWTY